MIGAATGTTMVKQRRFLASTAPSPAAPSLRYSRFVGVMKFALPLAAAALMGLVIGWPDTGPPRVGPGVVFAPGAGTATENLGMERARYTGLDRRQQPFVVTAGSVTPAGKDLDRVLLTDLQADMTLANGAWASLLATSGTFDRTLRTLELSGAVDIYADNGLELHTHGAFVDIGNGTAVGKTLVNGQGSFGLLRATGFEIRDRGERLLFSGRVKLTIYPAPSRGRG